jgi:hypothetical protein
MSAAQGQLAWMLRRRRRSPRGSREAACRMRRVFGSALARWPSRASRRSQASSVAAVCHPLMLEQHERGAVPADELGPDLPSRLGDRRRRAGLGDHSQVAGLRNSHQPHPEVSNALRSGAPIG